MPAVTAIKTNFSSGETSPLLFARVDVAKYGNGSQVLQNFIVQRYGGIYKRGGLEFINEVKDSYKNVRLIPFIYSVTQAYILEFGHLYVRFYTNGGIVESSPGVPLEVVTPWDQDDIWQLQYAQSADVLYLTHPDFAPRTLSRLSAISFALATMEFQDGPFLDLNTTATFLTPGDYASAVPKMTSNTAPSGTVSTTAGTDPWRIFDGSKSSEFVDGSNNAGTISYAFPGGQKVVDAYWIRSSIIDETSTPATWDIRGWNGVAWVSLDSRQGETGWARGERRFYEFTNKTAYQRYQIEWYGTSRTSGSETRIAEIGFHESGDTQPAFPLTASSTNGINDGAGFQASDVGRSLRLMGPDGKWRWARIVSRSSATVVMIRLYIHALPDLSPINNWAIGGWSEITGWPSSVSFFQGRLVFARTVNQPQTVWFSQVDDFTNFGESTPLVDSDAINATITSESLNEIKWLSENTTLLVGTTAAIRTIGPNTQTGAFGPANIIQRRETNYGASDVLPVRIGNVGVYSGYYRQDIREIAYSFQDDGYVSQDLSLLSEHIPRAGVKQLCFAQNPDGIVWASKDDGTWAGLTYEREQDVVAFHSHVAGGSFGVSAPRIESVATIPSQTRDEMWAVVKRTINGVTKQYIERLSLGLAPTASKEDATFLDSFLSYSGSAVNTLTGLDHLEGQQVQVWGDGSYLGEYTVVSGDITLSNDYTVTKACVGLPYTSIMETLSPEMGAAGGTAQTRTGSISDIYLRVNRSLGGSVGGADSPRLEMIYWRTTGDPMNTSPPLFTGDKRVQVQIGWDTGKRIRVEHSDPTPFQLLGMIYELKVNG
ncbi:hypothetical protein [Candidatus Phyllobacterium onerii]|uniref:hypothetical protein n=1 Tax=Candidatus Phyllobacterium onerii TaxID=3020828 RepID=UPI002330DB63|nr:hypothetical protein [Phyllobacterium sp. IY22]